MQGNAKNVQRSQVCNIMLSAIIQRVAGVAAGNDVLIVFAINQTRAFSFTLDLFFSGLCIPVKVHWLGKPFPVYWTM